MLVRPQRMLRAVLEALAALALHLLQLSYQNLLLASRRFLKLCAATDTPRNMCELPNGAARAAVLQREAAELRYARYYT